MCAGHGAIGFRVPALCGVSEGSVIRAFALDGAPGEVGGVKAGTVPHGSFSAAAREGRALDGTVQGLPYGMVALLVVLDAPPLAAEGKVDVCSEDRFAVAHVRVGRGVAKRVGAMRPGKIEVLPSTSGGGELCERDR